MKSAINPLKRDKEAVEKALKKYLKGVKGPARLKEAVCYAVLGGGKRLRPVLTMESCRALDGDMRKALPFACCVELIHNFSLVHDDLPGMDNDDFRRGKPSCHRRFGEGLAILAGDALLNLAFGILGEQKNEDSLEAVFLVSKAVGTENMIGGQALDIMQDSESDGRIDAMKTASLMALSCELGALAARGGPEERKLLREFGKNLGLAFQIADDICDGKYEKSALEKMKRRSGFFISKAKGKISFLGRKADTLLFIADGVLKKAGGRR